LLGTTDLSFPGFRACYSEAGTTSLVEVIRPVEAITAQRFSSPFTGQCTESHPRQAFYHWIVAHGTGDGSP
jgi:hypothetical protein